MELVCHNMFLHLQTDHVFKLLRRRRFLDQPLQVFYLLKVHLDFAVGLKGVADFVAFYYGQEESLSALAELWVLGLLEHVLEALNKVECCGWRLSFSPGR